MQSKYLKIYERLYYFGTTTIESSGEKMKYFCHQGGGDFSHSHSKGEEKYIPLSRTFMVKFYDRSKDIKIIVSENYCGRNGFYANNFENLNKIIEMMFPKK